MRVVQTTGVTAAAPDDVDAVVVALNLRNFGATDFLRRALQVL